MQIILASAKIMNDNLKSVPDVSLSTPRFQKEPEDLCAFSYEGFVYDPKLGALGPMGRLPEQEPNYPHFIKQ